MLGATALAVTCLLPASCRQSDHTTTSLPPAPEHLITVVPQLLRPHEPLAPNLLYEANNPLMRHGLSDGAAIAARWRDTAERSGGLFVLRDSLWSQQDHPTRNAPLQLILPPSWITAAASVAEIRPVRAFELDDDKAWTGLTDEAALFGSFPPSRTLYRLATMNLQTAKPGRRERITHARRSLQQLDRMTVVLQRAARHGWRAVVTAGAMLIAAGDRTYFGADTRRNHIIPIFVENPAPHEIAEGKGYLPPGLQVSTELRHFVAAEVCRHRLRDGDIALERYDLSDPNATERALDLLSRIIPPGAEGTTVVWLWVTGRLRPADKLEGHGPLPYTEGFLRQVAARPIDLSRLKLLSKPSESVGPGFPALVDAYRRASLYVSVDAGAERMLTAGATGSTSR